MHRILEVYNVFFFMRIELQSSTHHSLFWSILFSTRIHLIEVNLANRQVSDKMVELQEAHRIVVVRARVGLLSSPVLVLLRFLNTLPVAILRGSLASLWAICTL